MLRAYSMEKTVDTIENDEFRSVQTALLKKKKCNISSLKMNQNSLRNLIRFALIIAISFGKK